MTKTQRMQMMLYRQLHLTSFVGTHAEYIIIWLDTWSTHSIYAAQPSSNMVLFGPGTIESFSSVNSAAADVRSDRALSQAPPLKAQVFTLKHESCFVIT